MKPKVHHFVPPNRTSCNRWLDLYLRDENGLPRFQNGTRTILAVQVKEQVTCKTCNQALSHKK